MSHPLAHELLELLGRSDRIGPAFEQWRRRCAATLDRLPDNERRHLIDELRSLIGENRSLFEHESQGILDDLIGERPNTAGAAKAGRYRSVKDLKN